MHVRRRLATLVSVAATSALVAPSPTGAAEDQWSPLQGAEGSTLAIALEDGTTLLLSAGGPDDATIHDRRRSTDGTVGPPTEVTAVSGVETCRPVEAVTALGSVAVAVECLTKTGLEDPPTTIVELVWTADGGWAWFVQPDSELGSVDYSTNGQHAVFTTNSEYGHSHHLTSFHADLGWRDLTRRELPLSEDDLVAAISDSGDLVALRGAGSEDEPGSWFGGRLLIETYDDASGRWTRRFARTYPDGGIDPEGIDLAGGRFVATVVQSRSTGELIGLEDRIVVLTGRPGNPRLWSSPRWSRHVLTASAAITQQGVGVAAWHAVGNGRTAKPWFATWAPQGRPTVHDLKWRTTLTDAAVSGRALDLSVNANGHGVIAYVRQQRGDHHSTVAGVSFSVGRRGALGGQTDATWQQPVDTSVNVTASANGASITLGGMIGPFYPSPDVRYSVLP